MLNPKTTPLAPKPQARDLWIRKSDLDAWLDRNLPVPTQVISNEEYLPIPQTPEQRRLESEIIVGAERQSRLAGMDRRQFLRTAWMARLPQLPGMPELPNNYSKITATRQKANQKRIPEIAVSHFVSVS